MRRRMVLASIGALSTALGGCLDGSRDPQNRDRNDSESKPDVSQNSSEQYSEIDGILRDVVDGKLLGVEHWEYKKGEGQLFALDTETGDVRWKYGRSGPYTTYSELAIGDAIYAGFGDDYVSGSGHLVAVERDGEKRWRKETGSIYHKPRLGDGIVSVGSDDRIVRAFDTESGDLLWQYDEFGDWAPGFDKPAVAALDDVVYVQMGDVYALDPEDGSPEWTWENGDNTVDIHAVEDGVAYVTSDEWAGAIENGERRWMVELDRPYCHCVDSGSVVLTSNETVYAVDVDSGDERWRFEANDSISDRPRVHNGQVYLVAGQLYSFDAMDGTELARVDIDGRIAAVTHNTEDGHAVFLESSDDKTDRTELRRILPTGEVTWTETVDTDIRSIVVDERVYAGTPEGIYAFDPQ